MLLKRTLSNMGNLQSTQLLCRINKRLILIKISLKIHLHMPDPTMISLNPMFVISVAKAQSQQFDQNQHYKPPYVSRSSAAITSRPISYSPTLETTGGKSKSKVYIPVLVNGITTTALVDTGSTESYVNKNFIEVHNIVSHPRLQETPFLSSSPTVQNLKWFLRYVQYLFLLPMKKALATTPTLHCR